MRVILRSLLCLLCAVPILTTSGQTGVQVPKDTARSNTSAKKPWYTTFTIRGHGHVRYNRLLETNEKSKCEQCDKSIGEGGGFFIRRARIIFQGYVHRQVFIHLQPDFASSDGGAQMPSSTWSHPPQRAPGVSTAACPSVQA